MVSYVNTSKVIFNLSLCYVCCFGVAFFSFLKQISGEKEGET